MDASTIGRLRAGPRDHNRLRGKRRFRLWPWAKASALLIFRTDHAEINAKNTTEQLSYARPKSAYDAGHIDKVMSMWWKELQAEDGAVNPKRNVKYKVSADFVIKIII